MVKERRLSRYKARAAQDHKDEEGINPAILVRFCCEFFWHSSETQEKDTDTLPVWPKTACIGGAREGNGSFKVVCGCQQSTRLC